MSFCRSEPGGRVARVHEHAQPGREALLVEPLEGGERQVDLAAHLDQRRHASPLQALRAAPRSCAGWRVTSSPIVPSPRVAPRVSDAVLVDERDREPVDLRLGDVGDVVVEALLGQQPARARVPGRQRLVVARVREREHRQRCSTGANPSAAARRRAASASPACAARAAAPRAPAARGRARRTRRPRSRARRARGRAAGGATSSARSQAARSAGSWAGSSGIGGEDVSELGGRGRDRIRARSAARPS